MVNLIKSTQQRSQLLSLIPNYTTIKIALILLTPPTMLLTLSSIQTTSILRRLLKTTRGAAFPCNRNRSRNRNRQFRRRIQCTAKLGLRSPTTPQPPCRPNPIHTYLLLRRRLLPPSRVSDLNSLLLLLFFYILFRVCLFGKFVVFDLVDQIRWSRLKMCLGNGGRRRRRQPRRLRISLGTCGNTVSIVIITKF